MTTTPLLVGKLHQSDMLGGHHKNGRQLREQKSRLGHPGYCPAVPTLTTIVPDDSGSLSGPTGNDPVSNRYAEARRALEAIGRHCHCGNCLVAVVHFDTPTSGCVEPTPLTRAGRQRLGSGLGIPRDSAGTSYLGPSLAKTEELAANYPDHQNVLIILTDWALFDHDLASIFDRIVAFPGTVVAVGLRNPVPEIVTGPNIRCITLSTDSPPGTLAKAVFDGLTIHREPR